MCLGIFKEGQFVIHLSLLRLVRKMYEDLRRGYGRDCSFCEELNKIVGRQETKYEWDLFPSNSLFHAVLWENIQG